MFEAWLKEVEQWSLSSWRAWIEIYGASNTITVKESLSSWRAWIEMAMACQIGVNWPVALLMESVD